MSEKAESGAIRGVLALLIGIIIVVLGVNLAFSQEIENRFAYVGHIEQPTYILTCPTRNQLDASRQHLAEPECSVVDKAILRMSSSVKKVRLVKEGFVDVVTEQLVVPILYEYCFNGRTVHSFEFPLVEEHPPEVDIFMETPHIGLFENVTYRPCKTDRRELRVATITE